LSRRAMPRRGLLNLPFVTFLVGTKCSFRHTPTELTADGDIAVLPADIRFHRVAPRFPVDAGYVAARVARTVQHRRQIWPERVPMRVLIRPPLARQTAGRYVYCTSVVTPVVLIAVHWITQESTACDFCSFKTDNYKKEFNMTLNNGSATNPSLT